jgi:iron(III) transport system substrate-binding protein
MKSTFLVFLWFLMILSGCGQSDKNVVTVYVSEDEVFSQPILKDFERDTKIKVQTIYDTEEAKGAGLMNRLIAEKNNPQADVYWGNEPVRLAMLKEMSISEPYRSPNAANIADIFKDREGYWTGFSARLRVLIVKKDAANKPNSIGDYVDNKYRGKGVIANPLFGTTSVQVAALFTTWGDEKGKQFLKDLKANGVKISTSNGESADLVASGEFDFSLVDSDDSIARARQGKNVGTIYPDQGPDGIGTLVVPNGVALIRKAPHPENARKLIDYLLSKETERKLAFADCAQIPLHKGVETPPDVPTIDKVKVMEVDYSRLADKLKSIQPFLKEWAGL